MKIALVAGARPNFMKIAPIVHELAGAHNQAIEYILVHTGQHYDDRLSKIFFEQLNIPDPHINLAAGSGTQAEQTGKIMVEFEKFLLKQKVDLVVVVGDVTSTLACTIVAKKLEIKVAHIEGGIRSFDMSMPEEINRLVTDSISDYFFTTSEVANANLERQGVRKDQIFFVGNTMIDTLYENINKTFAPPLWNDANLIRGNYYVLTLHRPSNVDDLAKFTSLITSINSAVEKKIIFPIHPRTRRNFDSISGNVANILATDPLSYLEFIHLVKNAKGVITDSGGIQEETTVLGIPCVTLRTNTERPETVSVGTNELIGDDLHALTNSILKIERNEWKNGAIPKLWDGKTSKRIVSILKTLG